MTDRYFSPGSKKTPEPSMRVKHYLYCNQETHLITNFHCRLVCPWSGLVGPEGYVSNRCSGRIWDVLLGQGLFNGNIFELLLTCQLMSISQHQNIFSYREKDHSDVLTGPLLLKPPWGVCEAHFHQAYKSCNSITNLWQCMVSMQPVSLIFSLRAMCYHPHEKSLGNHYHTLPQVCDGIAPMTQDL